jgi:hypothetical protein
MPEAEENLEEIVRRPAPREPAPDARRLPADLLGQCECGARITAADLYGERGDVDLGRPRLRSAERFLQFRCPLCGRVGELRVES